MEAAVEVVVRALRAVRDAVVGFAGDTLTAVEAARFVEEIARTEKALAALRARVAARAVDAGAHRARGFADAADWLAAVAGSTRHDARTELAAAAAGARSPDVDRALVAGDISLAQAAAIAAAADAAPGCEPRLVSLASGAGLGPVRDAARRVALAATDPEALHLRQRSARYLRHWRDEAGMVCLSAALPPDVGVAFVTRLDAETSRLRRRSRRAAGPVEPTESYAADALVRLATAGSGRAVRRRSSAISRRRRRRVRPACVPERARPPGRAVPHRGRRAHTGGLGSQSGGVWRRLRQGRGARRRRRPLRGAPRAAHQGRAPDGARARRAARLRRRCMRRGGLPLAAGARVGSRRPSGERR